MKILNLTLIVILILYAALGTFMRYEADDYCQAVNVHERGIIGGMVQQYTDWQGRYSGTLADLAAYAALDSAAPAVVPALLILGMVGGWLYLLRPIHKQHALTLALALTLGFISGVPNLWQSIMWVNGSLNYVPPLIGALFLSGWLWRRVPSLPGSSSRVSMSSGV